MPMTQAHRVWALLVALALVAACGTAANSAADGARGQPPPPDQSAREALAALETTPEQDDQLLALVGKFAIVLSKSGKTRRAFTEQLIKSLLLGRVDAAAMSPARADFEQALRDAMPEVLALLNELHGILTPKQRVDLVDGLAARAKDSEALRKARNKEMLDELDIGLVQKVTIAKAMADQMEELRPAFDKMKTDAKAATEAFKRDDFDATKLKLVETDLGKLYLEGAVALVGALSPELEYEQRRALADIIKHRLSGGDRRRP